MKKIVFDNPHRQKHFDFFNGMNHPHFSITSNVDVSRFLEQSKSVGLPFSHSLIYCLSRTANEIKEFRWRIRENTVIEHQTVHPSFTVSNDKSDVFSFCTVTFKNGINTFIAEAKKVQENMKSNPSLEDQPGRDDYLFLSAIPWVSFTSIQHAMHFHPHDSVPRISWGKFFEQNGKILMPVSIQAHHALVDGRHMGAYFETLQNHLNSIQDEIKTTHS